MMARSAGHGWLAGPAMAWAMLLLGASLARAEETIPTGREIYQAKCILCHGKQGRGVEGLYGKPLVGDRSISELTKIIETSMPDGAPELCVGEEAARVAEYIYNTFYSEEARAGSRSVRFQLSRLTVRQYETVMADLIGSFRDQGGARRYWRHKLARLRRPDSAAVPAPQPRGKEAGKHEDLPPHGLHGSYYKSRVVNFRDRTFDRIDPVVDFDFGTGNPDPRLPGDEFAMAWEGSVFAPATGEYTFVVETDNGARLFVNNMDEPLIDKMVKSGNGTLTYKKTIRLLGGRTYSIRLEYHRSKRAKQASISLRWERPHHPVQVIGERFLAPFPSPEVYVVDTPFPPDDRSTGYIRGTSVTKEWNRAVAYAAIEAANYITRNINELADTSPNDKNRTEKIKEFCRAFAERAFRRPLTDKVAEVVVGDQFKQAGKEGKALTRSLLLILTSPRFLYRERLSPEHDDFDIATRLSFALWDSLPDEQLLEAARKGELSDPDLRRRQVRRMFDDRRTHAKLRQFFHHWLNLEEMHGLVKDDKKFPNFDKELASDLRRSLNLFVEEVVWSQGSDFRELLLADTCFLNQNLAEFYGVEIPAGGGFVEVPFQPQHRAGVLTHPYLMAGFAYSDESSPIHRGVFIARSILGRTLDAPPNMNLPEPPGLHPDLTTRERFALQTSPPECMRCHSLINPLGFSFAHYDSVGRFRTHDNDKPVNAKTVYTSSGGETIQLDSALDLADYVAESRESHEVFVEQIFRHLAKQPIQAYGPKAFDRLVTTFEESDYNIRKLVIEAALVISMPAEAKPVKLTQHTSK